MFSCFLKNMANYANIDRMNNNEDILSYEKYQVSKTFKPVAVTRIIINSMMDSEKYKKQSFFYDLRIDSLNKEFYGNFFYGNPMKNWLVNEQSILNQWVENDAQKLKTLIQHSCDNKCKPLLKAICDTMTDYYQYQDIAIGIAQSYDEFIDNLIIPKTFKFIKAKPKHVDIMLTKNDIEWMADGGIRKLAGDNSSRIASYTSLYLHKKQIDITIPDYDDIMSTYHWNDVKNGNPVDFIFSIYDSNELMLAKRDFISIIMNDDTISNMQSHNNFLFEGLKHIPWLRASNNDNMTNNNDTQWFTDAYKAYNAYLEAMNTHYDNMRADDDYDAYDEYMKLTEHYLNEAFELLTETQLQPIGWLNTEFTIQNIIRAARTHEPCYAVSAFILISALLTLNGIINKMNIELCNDDGYAGNGIMGNDIGFISFDINDDSTDDETSLRRNRELIREAMGLMFTDYPYEYIIERIKMLIMNTPEYEALNLTDDTGKHA